MDKHCKNCEHPVLEEHKYCPKCGQKTNDELTITVLFNNTITNYFSVDARFFVSFLPLLFRPGYLPQKFVEGQRMRYLHPAQFYLFISVIFFFLLSFETRKQQQAFDESLRGGFELDLDSAQIHVSDSVTELVVKETMQGENTDELGSGTNSAELDSIITQATKIDSNIDKWQKSQSNLDSLIKNNAPLDEKLKALGYKEGAANWKRKAYIQILKIIENRGGGLLAAFYDTVPIAMFFLLPIYGLLLKLLFWRRGRFSHHLVFSFYFFSFLFTVFTIMLLANFIYQIPDWIDWTLVLLTGVYLIIAIKKFYAIRIGEAIIRTIAVSFLYFMFVIPTSLFFMALISFFIY